MRFVEDYAKQVRVFIMNDSVYVYNFIHNDTL